MELRQLEYFLVVAEELNFSRAAERLTMTQPPLSMQIKSLERELGMPLFERSTRRVRLTAAGEIFVVSTRRLLAQLEDNVRRARGAALGQTGHLALGFVPSAMLDILPPLLRAFRTQSSSVQLVTNELRPEQQVQGLLSGALDVGLFYLPQGEEPPFGEESLVSAPLTEEALVAALPADHPAAGRSSVAVGELAGEPFVMVAGHRGSGLRDAVREQCRRGGILPEVVQEGALVQTIAGLVASGVGVALLPASVQRLNQAGVVYVRLEDEPVTVRMGLVWRRDSANPVVPRFVAASRSAVSGIHISRE